MIVKVQHIFDRLAMDLVNAYHCRNVFRYNIKQLKRVTQEIDPYIVAYPKMSRMYVVQETVTKECMLVGKIWCLDNITKG